MLRGIPEVINPTLLKALAEMGHGDVIAIVDDFYPATTMSRNGICVDADGIPASVMLDAILKLMPLDVDFTEHSVQIMDVMEDQKSTIKRPEEWDEFIEAVKRNEPKGEACIGFINRFDFYKKAKTAFVHVSTGERRPYGCVLLTKGLN